MVRRGLVIAWRLAGSPTRRSPLSVKATTLGVRRLPSWLGMTLASLPSITATTEFVVPRSIPMIFSSAIVGVLLSERPARQHPRGLAPAQTVRFQVLRENSAAFYRPLPAAWSIPAHF